MPSPFPGMDPYLEERALWPDLHQRLITYISESLQPQVRPKYIARIGERIEVAGLQRGYIPDVLVVEPPSSTATLVTAGGIMVADEPLTVTYLDEEQHIPYIEIIYRETGDVVTVIEVLSPANKFGEGRGHYLTKQEELLSTHANLVEIDLLGFGQPTTLARLAPIDPPVNWRYTVSISRAGRRHRLDIYAFSLMERLPRCRIPLRATDADVVLDLPAVFTRCYEIGSYDLLIDYTKAPTVALSDTEQAWIRQQLQELDIQSPQ